MQYRRPSPRMWLARQTVLGLTSAGLAAILGASGGLLWGRAGALVGIGAALALAIGSWLVERGRYRSWGYLERDEDLVVRRGLLFHRLTVVPFGRMQFVDVTAGPVDRLFDLATVQLHTAAAATDARIPGLRSVDAAQLRDRLATLGEARASGL
ncbi:MAG: PH domain-containing protein [Candidatus Dormibacteria bacterium]